MNGKLIASILGGIAAGVGVILFLDKKTLPNLSSGTVTIGDVPSGTFGFPSEGTGNDPKFPPAIGARNPVWDRTHQIWRFT